MRLTTAFGLLIAISVPVRFCSGQATNTMLTVSGYPVPRTVALSIDDAVRLAVEHNLNLRLQRFEPQIVAYDLQAAYGDYYDPKFDLGWRRNDVVSQGAFNTTLGIETPSSFNQNDTLSSGLSGNLPTGMRYQLSGTFAEHFNNRFVTFPAPGRVLTNYFTGDAGISVSQPLLRDLWIDNNRLRLKLGKQDKKIADLRVEDLAQKTVSDTVQTYFQLMGALESVKVAQADVGFNQQLFEETRKRVQAGQRAALDETKAQAAVAASRTSLVDAMNTAADAEAKLKALISDDYINQVNMRLAPTEKLVLSPAIIDFQTSVRTGLERRPEVLIAREQVESQNITLKYTYNQLFPRLDVVAGWGVTGAEEHQYDMLNDLGEKKYQTDNYGLQFSTPLTFWAERHRHRAAKMQKEKLLMNLQAVEETVIKDVDDAIRAVRNAHERAALTRDEIIYAEADVDAQQKKYSAGKATSLDVLDAQTRLTAARNKQIQAIVDYNVALAFLARAEGLTLEEHKIDFESVHVLRQPRR